MTIISSTRNTTAVRSPKRTAKRVVLAGRIALGAKVAEQFRTLGWEVHTVAPGCDVHAAAAETEPHAVLLQEAAGDESGYLTCAKLRRTQPNLKVIVIGAERTANREKFAAFVGAGFATETDGANALVAAVS